LDTRVEHLGLAPLDWAVIVAYLLALIGIGLYYRRAARTGLASFFLGGRTLPGWLNGVSNAATCMNADVAPAYCGMAVITGTYVCWFYFSRFGMALLVAGVLFAVYWRRLGVSTSPEFYELRFSGKSATALRLIMSLRSAFVGVVVWIGAGLLGLTKIVEALLGWNRWETLAVVIPVLMLYVLLSGYVGVVVSDVIQTLIMVASSIALMVLVWREFGGPAGLHDALVARWGPEIVSWHPPPAHEFLGVIGLLAWTLGTSLGYGGDLSTESQKLLSCRNAREASKMYVWTEVVLFLLLAVLTLPALAATLHWPGLREGAINKELSFGLLIGRYLPPGWLGLALVALCASIMSTVDSHLSYAGQVFVNDVYLRWIRRDAPTGHCLVVGKLVMVAIMGLAILVATAFTNVIDISLFMLGLFGAELAANWAQWWWWRFNGKARIAACVGGPLIYWCNSHFVFGEWIDLWASTAYVVVLVSIAATACLWIGVALFTAPDAPETLTAFYRQARPPGAWGPVAAAAGMRSAGWRPVVRGFPIAALGFITIAASTLALSGGYVGNWWSAGASGAVAFISGVIFWRCYRPFLDEIENMDPHADAIAANDASASAGQTGTERDR